VDEEIAGRRDLDVADTQGGCGGVLVTDYQRGAGLGWDGRSESGEQDGDPRVYARSIPPAPDGVQPTRGSS
jgi:hypothetical protein